VNGLICYNDLVAVGALQACAELGLRVPDDVAIVGFDDAPLAALVTPALTTLRIPKYEIGADAARMLFERIQGQRNQAEIVHKPELVICQSTPKVSS
jgi:LacI family transcriptional regulator